MLNNPIPTEQASPSAYERTRDRFHYRFENPSSFDTSELVPHEFTQTYWGDNHWFVVRGVLRRKRAWTGRSDFNYRQDRSEFHPGLKLTQHTQPPSRVEEWIYTRETTISRTYGVTVRPRRTWEGAAWRLSLGADTVPLMTGRLTTLLPDKYPGRTIVFSALVMSVEPKATIELGRRRAITISAGYNRTLSYLKSLQFVRKAANIGVGVCF